MAINATTKLQVFHTTWAWQAAWGPRAETMGPCCNVLRWCHMCSPQGSSAGGLSSTQPVHNTMHLFVRIICTPVHNTVHLFASIMHTTCPQHSIFICWDYAHHFFTIHYIYWLGLCTPSVHNTLYLLASIMHAACPQHCIYLLVLCISPVHNTMYLFTRIVHINICAQKNITSTYKQSKTWAEWCSK